MRRFALVAAVLVTACGGEGGGGEPIQIGLMAPQTGALDFVGDSFALVAQSAVDKINAEGGIDGRELVLTVGDTRTDPTVVPALFEGLIADPTIVASVGPATSGEVAAAYPIAAERRVPIISPSSTAPDLSDPTLDDGYMFRNVPDDLIQGKAMAYYLREILDPPVDEVTVLFEDTDYGRGLKNAFKVEFEDLGGIVNTNEVGFTNNMQHVCCAASATSCGDASCTAQDATCGVDHTTETPAGPDLSGLPKLCAGPLAEAAIADVASNAPTYTVMVALEQDAAELALAWDNEGAPVVDGMQFFMTDGARSGGFLDFAPDSIVGMCGTAPTFPVQGDAYEELEDTFEADHPGQSLADQVFAPNVWDGVYLIAAALLKQLHDRPGDPVGGAALREAITAVSDEGQTFHAGEWRNLVLAIQAGNDVDYDGAAGPNDFDVRGQAVGPYEVWCIAEGLEAFDQTLFLEAQEIQNL